MSPAQIERLLQDILKYVIDRQYLAADEQDVLRQLVKHHLRSAMP